MQLCMVEEGLCIDRDPGFCAYDVGVRGPGFNRRRRFGVLNFQSCYGDVESMTIVMTCK